MNSEKPDLFSASLAALIVTGWRVAFWLALMKYLVWPWLGQILRANGVKGV